MSEVKSSQKGAFVKKGFILLLILWVGMGILTVGLNYFKLASIELSEYFMTDDEIRIKYFGEEYELIKTLNTYVSDSDELLIVSSSNSELNFLSKYFLYPTKVKYAEGLQRVPHSELINVDFILLNEKTQEDLLMSKKNIPQNFTTVFETEAENFSSFYKNE